jgi:hypothetical protein
VRRTKELAEIEDGGDEGRSKGDASDEVWIKQFAWWSNGTIFEIVDTSILSQTKIYYY